MIKELSYELSEVLPYINWIYFYFAWAMNGKPEQERARLKRDALQMLDEWEGKYHTHAIFGVFEANSDGDDLILGKMRFPMLRQQRPSTKGAPCLCLADFVRPLDSGIKDSAGAFATTMDAEAQHENNNDEYRRMMAQVLADRLAEGTAEKMHEEVRRRYWGYAPDEQLTMQQTHNEEYQGIRPAVGYPSLPDTSVNFLLNDLLGMEKIGIRLTESGMMIPHASVSGLMFSHSQSRYFELGKIGEDQLRDYARRRGLPVELVRKFLQSSMLKK